MITDLYIHTKHLYRYVNIIYLELIIMNKKNLLKKMEQFFDDYEYEHKFAIEDFDTDDPDYEVQDPEITIECEISETETEESDDSIYFVAMGNWDNVDYKNIETEKIGELCRLVTEDIEKKLKLEDGTIESQTPTWVEYNKKTDEWGRMYFNFVIEL